MEVIIIKKINIVKKSDEINDIIHNGKFIKNKYYYIYYKENNLKNYRFAICVSKKIGNAVNRNKNKRQIKDILDKSNLLFKTGTDYVIIVSKEINNINYHEKNDELINIISKILD